MSSISGDYKFDSQKFNKEFDIYKQNKKDELQDEANDRLEDKSSIIKRKKIYDHTIMELMINIKDTWFEILDDILDHRFTLGTIFKNNRLFYIGITIFVFTCILYLYGILFDTFEEETEDSESIKRIYHIHQLPTMPPMIRNTIPMSGTT